MIPYLKHALSMGTLVWKVSQILGMSSDPITLMPEVGHNEIIFIDSEATEILLLLAFAHPSVRPGL